MMQTIWKDLRYGTRLWLKNPGFTMIAILTLGLGIGANTAIFSVVNGLLLRPLPYRDAERLAIIWTHSPGANVAQDWPSPGQFSAMKSENSVFEELALAQGGNVLLTTPSGSVERLGIVRTKSVMFPMLGVQAAMGRVFLPEEDAPGKATTVVISHGFWESRYSKDPKALGQSLTINGESYTIVGVTPAGFTLGFEVMPTVGGVKEPELFLPLPLDSKRMSSQGDENYNVLARLKPEATIEQAQTELNLAVRRLEQQFPNNYPASRRFNLSIRPLLEQVVGDVRLALYVLLGAVGCVLLIACVNVANLLLARSASREKEIAIRAALGAGRGRIIRQLLTESLLLAIGGGLLGVLIAVWSLAGLRWLNPGNIPRIANISVDGRALAFTSAIALLTGLLFGLVPALRNSRGALGESLKEGGRNLAGGGHQRLRDLLVITETALSLILLVGAGLLIRSFLNVQRVDPGFDPRNVLSFRMAAAGPSYKEGPQVLELYQQVWDRLRRSPGVESVGGVTVLPLTGGIGWGSISIEGYSAAAGQMMIQADGRTASVGYFETMKTTLLRGRFFTEQDTKDSVQVAIIDENMARSYWPNTDPTGKRFKQGGADSTAPWYTVVGVVGNVKQYGLDSDARVAYYRPHLQEPNRFLNVVVRTAGDPLAFAPVATREVRALNPSIPIFDVKSMDQWLQESLARRRFSMFALALFAAAAMILAAIGLYGVISYMVSQRTKEIGVRIALGAQSRDVQKMVIRQGMSVAVIGVGVGLIGAVAVTRVMASLLYGVSARDIWTFAAIAVLLTLAALLASWIPARRATKVDPMVALRAD
jgi:predicted permease